MMDDEVRKVLLIRRKAWDDAFREVYKLDFPMYQKSELKTDKRVYGWDGYEPIHWTNHWDWR